MVPLDLKGNITLVLSLLNLYMLVLGLPLIRKPKNAKKLIKHGYLTIVALVIQTGIVAAIMLPSFEINMGHILALKFPYSFDAWFHFGLGSFTEISGFVYVGSWLIFKSSRMQCARAKKYMVLTLSVWIVAIITGALIHILQIF
jgi:hypothetical protein